jgi:hypothetical protein
LIGGKKAINILECKVDTENLLPYPKKETQSIIADLRRAIDAYGIQQEIKRIREKEEKR